MSIVEAFVDCSNFTPSPTPHCVWEGLFAKAYQLNREAPASQIADLKCEEIPVMPGLCSPTMPGW